MSINIKNVKSNLKYETDYLKKIKLARKKLETELKIVTDKKRKIGLKLIRADNKSSEEYNKLKHSYDKLAFLTSNLANEFVFYDKLYVNTDQDINAKYTNTTYIRFLQNQKF